MTPAASRVDPEPGLDGLLSVDAARDAVLVAIPGPTDSEVVWLFDALGRVLATDVVSELDLPPWDNSAMDGYAVRSADLAAASETAPVLLRVAGDIPAGVAPKERVEPPHKAKRISSRQREQEKWGAAPERLGGQFQRFFTTR